MSPSCGCCRSRRVKQHLLTMNNTTSLIYTVLNNGSQEEREKILWLLWMLLIVERSECGAQKFHFFFKAPLLIDTARNRSYTYICVYMYIGIHMTVKIEDSRILSLLFGSCCQVLLCLFILSSSLAIYGHNHDGNYDIPALIGMQ